jgi:hypothetical protein
MGFNRISVNPQEVEKVGRMAEVALQLRPAADRILSQARSKAPDWLREDGNWFTRSGVSRRGAYAQAIVQHPGAVGAEYGGERSEPVAMFRSSIR